MNEEVSVVDSLVLCCRPCGANQEVPALVPTLWGLGQIPSSL